MSERRLSEFLKNDIYPTANDEMKVEIFEILLKYELIVEIIDIFKNDFVRLMNEKKIETGNFIYFVKSVWLVSRELIHDIVVNWILQCEEMPDGLQFLVDQSYFIYSDRLRLCEKFRF